MVQNFTLNSSGQVRALIPVVIFMHNVDTIQLKASSLYSRHIIPPVYGKHQEDPLIAERESMGDQSRVCSPVISRCSSPCGHMPLDSGWVDIEELSRTPSYTSAIDRVISLQGPLPPPYV